MAEVVSGKSRKRMSFTITETEEGVDKVATVTINEAVTSANGTDAGDVDLLYRDQGTLSAETPVDFDLDSGLASPLGDSQTFVEVVEIYVENTGATNDMDIKGDFLGLSTDHVNVPPGGHHLFYFGTVGEAVTATDKDVITLESTSGTTYDLIITGRSA